MSVHDKFLKDLLACKAQLDKVGNAVDAKAKADITKKIASLSADFKKIMEQGAQAKKRNDHLNMLNDQVEAYRKKTDDGGALIKLIQKVNDDADADYNTIKKLADSVKKTDAKSGKILADIAEAFGSVGTDTESTVIFIGTF